MARAISYSLFRQIELSTNQNVGRRGPPTKTTSLPLPFKEKEHEEKESGTRGSGVLAKITVLPLLLVSQLPLLAGVCLSLWFVLLYLLS